MRRAALALTAAALSTASGLAGCGSSPSAGISPGDRQTLETYLSNARAAVRQGMPARARVALVNLEERAAGLASRHRLDPADAAALERAARQALSEIAVPSPAVTTATPTTTPAAPAPVPPAPGHPDHGKGKGNGNGDGHPGKGDSGGD